VLLDDPLGAAELCERRAPERRGAAFPLDLPEALEDELEVRGLDPLAALLGLYHTASGEPVVDPPGPDLVEERLHEFRLGRVALAAEPLYVLADTAIVGHLGTPQLGALALAGTLVTALLQLSDFLSYGTTAQVARLHGAGEVRYLAGAMVAELVVFAPIALAASTLTALWAALLALMAVRLLTTGARFARGRWAVLGAG